MTNQSNWTGIDLGSIADVVLGGTPSTANPDYWIPEIEWVTAKDISKTSTAKIYKTERLISKLGLEKSPAKVLPPLTTVIIARGATMGKCRMLGRSMALNQTCYGIIARRNYADPIFLYYYLSNLYDYFRAVANGSVFDTVIGSGLRSIKIKLPSLPEQRAIADVLGSLDDKIELNRRMNATLESIAMAMFRQWFIENEESKGWKAVPLPEMIDVNPSRALRKSVVAPYLDMANMPTQGHRAIEWVDRPFGSGTKFINGDTLLARITPCLENGKTAFVDFLADGQIGWGSTEYIILRPKPPLPVEYGYYLARSEELRNHTIQNMTGTSGRQRAPASCFDKYMIAIPSESIVMRFGDFVRTNMVKIRANDEQSRTLAAMRDALLPRLINGEVRMKDVEKKL